MHKFREGSRNRLTAVQNLQTHGRGSVPEDNTFEQFRDNEHCGDCQTASDHPDLALGAAHGPVPWA